MKLLFQFLIVLGSISVVAQNSLSGTITNTKNKPLYGVEIYATELHKGTITDKNGNYIFNNIPNGNIKITINYIGYTGISKTFVFNSESKTFTTQLKEAIFKMDEVIISTPFNKLQSENVMKVERLTAKSLQRMGAITLSEGINNIAGVSQISTGVSIGKPVIRGLSGNRVLVYTQGVRLENQQFGEEHGLGINDAGIASIEVIKGPASLLYGSDALGGVLYINPEKFAPENKSIFTVNQRYFSNTLGSNTSLGAKTSTEDWKFLARGTYAIHSDYKTPNNQRVTNTRFKEKDIKLGVEFNKTNFLSEVRYNFNNSQLGLTEGIDIQNIATTLLEPFQDINNHILSFHNHIFFGDSKLDADFGYILNDRQEFEKHEDEANHHQEETAALRTKLKTFSYNLKYHLPKGKKLETLIGIQGMRQTNTNFGEELLIPNAKINDFGVFTTINFPFDEHNTLQAGVRFDNRTVKTERHEVVHDNETHIFNAIDKSYNSFTTSLGYKTQLFKKIQTRINIASGFRAPNVAELTSNGVHHGANRFEEGNNNLKKEKNLQLDISFEYNTKHFEVFANGFYNSINNYIYLSPTGRIEDESPVFNYIQNDAKLYGGEFGLHLHPHPLDWLHLESSFETVLGKQYNGNYLPLIPPNTWKNTFRIEFDIANWLQQSYASASLHSTFTQNKVSFFETKTPSYNLLNVGFGGIIHLGKIKFNTTLSINNALDIKYINHLSRLKNNNILNTGRNIVVGVFFKI